MDTRKIILIFAAVFIVAVISYTLLQKPGEKPITPQLATQPTPRATPTVSLKADEISETRTEKVPEPVSSPLQKTTPTPELQRVKLVEDAQRQAARLNLPLVGNLQEIEAGSDKNIHLTPEAVYVGTNQEVVDLLNKLGEEDAEARVEAVRELAEYVEDENLEPVMVRLLERDKDEEVRSAAAAALENAQMPSTIDSLILSLYDPSEEVREHARTSLGLIGSEEVRAKLKAERARTTDPEVREIIDQILEQVLDEPLSIEGEEE